MKKTNPVKRIWRAVASRISGDNMPLTQSLVENLPDIIVAILLVYVLLYLPYSILSELPDTSSTYHSQEKNHEQAQRNAKV